MRVVLKILLCAVFMMGLTACAAPTDRPQIKETHSAKNHIPPPVFSDGPEKTERICGVRGVSASACDIGEYCHREIKDICGAADAPGVCRVQPEICTQEYAPVCGCDGKTYSNGCTANSNGVSVSAYGECQG